MAHIPSGYTYYGIVDKLPLSMRKPIRGHSPKGECDACGQWGYLASYFEHKAICDACDRKVWVDDRDASQFDAGTERAQGLAS